jgi:hypothetical protein
MNQSRLIAGLTGGLLGLITIPVLGPFAALVTLSSGFAIRNILENLDANESDEDSDRATDEGTSKIDSTGFLDRHETISQSTVRHDQFDYNSLMNNIPTITPPRTPSYLDNLVINSTINTRSPKRKPPKKRERQPKGKIRIDEYGYIYDPKDQT